MDGTSSKAVGLSDALYLIAWRIRFAIGTRPRIGAFTDTAVIAVHSASACGCASSKMTAKGRSSLFIPKEWPSRPRDCSAVRPAEERAR